MTFLRPSEGPEFGTMVPNQTVLYTSTYEDGYESCVDNGPWQQKVRHMWRLIKGGRRAQGIPPMPPVLMAPCDPHAIKCMFLDVD